MCYGDHGRINRFRDIFNGYSKFYCIILGDPTTRILKRNAEREAKKILLEFFEIVIWFIPIDSSAAREVLKMTPNELINDRWKQLSEKIPYLSYCERVKIKNNFKLATYLKNASDNNRIDEALKYQCKILKVMLELAEEIGDLNKKEKILEKYGKMEINKKKN